MVIGSEEELIINTGRSSFYLLLLLSSISTLYHSILPICLFSVLVNLQTSPICHFFHSSVHPSYSSGVLITPSTCDTPTRCRRLTSPTDVTEAGSAYIHGGLERPNLPKWKTVNINSHFQELSRSAPLSTDCHFDDHHPQSLLNKTIAL